MTDIAGPFVVISNAYNGEEVVYGPDRLEFLDCAGLPETEELYETLKEKEVSWYEVAYDSDENMPYIIYHLYK